MSSLSGRVALITGGGTGIGRGIAEAFVAAGARVVLAGRRSAPLEEAAAALGENAVAVSADVTKADDRTRLLEETQRAFGQLDILVNNAGVVRGVGPIAELDAEDWERALAVNLTAPLFLSRDALPHLAARKGSILNVSTGAALKVVPNFAAYGATKAALNYVSRTLALEAAPDVRVNVICPGGVDTPIFETFVPADDVPGVHEFFADNTPLGRMGVPSDIAQAAVFLSSDEASWITGTLLVVDGGLNLA